MPHKPCAGPQDRPRSAGHTGQSPAWQSAVPTSSLSRCPSFRPESCWEWDSSNNRAPEGIAGRGCKRDHIRPRRWPVPTDLPNEARRGSAAKNWALRPTQAGRAPPDTARPRETTSDGNDGTPALPGDGPNLRLDFNWKKGASQPIDIQGDGPFVPCRSARAPDPLARSPPAGAQA